MKTGLPWMALVALTLAGSAAADQSLATKNNCMACHKIDAKLVGPSFKEIAGRYGKDPAAVDLLSARVKAGNKPGDTLQWGKVMMPASPASEADIRTIITWILAQQ